MGKGHGGSRIGAGRNPVSDNEKKYGEKIYITRKMKNSISELGYGKSFSEKTTSLLQYAISQKQSIENSNKVKFIDLFAGMGGLRLGFEQAFNESGLKTECVLTSEIKEYALQVISDNFSHELIVGDITKTKSDDIPDFDFLLAGFPCQAFSSAGKGLGFLDTRGTLFFEVERILRDKKPYGFILENVEGLVTHDKENKEDKIGRTLNTILNTLKKLGYNVSWKVLESQDFGVPQVRKRVFIVGSLAGNVDLNDFTKRKVVLSDVLEHGVDTVDSHFTRCLLSHYDVSQLKGKAIKDKRGGKNNIHSWDIELKGTITTTQRTILEKLFKERRRKTWALEIGIDWMDGMPLTASQIRTFIDVDNIKELLDDLVEKNYLVYEHPKKIVYKKVGDSTIKERCYDESKEKGYNIVTGKLSFEFSKILDSDAYAPTLVASDMSKLGVIDGSGIRHLTTREGLRIFGYPDSYVLDNTLISQHKIFDLLGNTVTVPVVYEVAKRLCTNFKCN